MSSRREFLKQIASAALIAGLTGIPWQTLARSYTKITILHTNDVHSHIDPFPENHPKFPGQGGAARRAALINQIRAEEKNVLLLDAGDVFQGTPYFNVYGGELEFKLMSQMRYDACTIGNHDFDNGIEGLAKQMPHANFPFINSNYDFSDTILKDKVKQWQIFEKDNIKIGIFGLGVELAGLVDARLYGNVKYLDPVVRAAEMSHLLKVKKKCDIVICLSHLGYRYNEAKISDQVLARESLNIDLIIGGHTHTFLDKPQSFKNREGKEVLIAQVGWAGIKLGRIDFYVDKKSGKKMALGNAVEIFEKPNEI